MEKQENELKEKVVAISRVAKVVKGGRNFRFSAVVVVVEILAFMSYSGMLMAHFYESVIDDGNGGAEPIAEQATVADGPAADFEEK